jgi:hypothetical protein
MLCALTSSAAVLDFATTFSPEATGATGTGSGFFQFDTTNQTLFIDVSWTGLSAGTTVAHIHCCTSAPFAGTVGVAVSPPTLPGFPTGVTSGTYQTLINLTLTGVYGSGFLNTNGGTAASASAALLQGIQEGRAYFNIHSTAFPGGEIRGFLQPVPEPGTMALAGVALLGLLTLRRRTGWGGNPTKP